MNEARLTYQDTAVWHLIKNPKVGLKNRTLRFIWKRGNLLEYDRDTIPNTFR